MSRYGFESSPHLEIHGQDDKERLNSLRCATSDILSSVLGADRSVALLDIPTHENVGDNMIWVGEERYLQVLHKTIAYEADIFRMDDGLLRKRLPVGPILLHGGGNFGDIWPLFQDFREGIVIRFPDRKIIQLPQTVKFQSAERAAQANLILGAHSDFTLLVRDTGSFERAHLQLPDVRTVFCPDMALGWQPTTSVRVPHQRLVVLRRRDRESAGDLVAALDSELHSGDVVADWGSCGYRRLLWYLARLPGRLARWFPLLRSSQVFYHVIRAANHFNRRQNLRAGVALLAGADAVVTDRLHAHVLACLLGVRNFVVDNNYCKVSSVFSDYTFLFDEATFVWNPSSIPCLVAEYFDHSYSDSSGGNR